MMLYKIVFFPLLRSLAVWDATTSSDSACSSGIIWEGRVNLQASGPNCIAKYIWNAVTFYTKVNVSMNGNLTAEINAGGKAMWLPIGKHNFNFANRWLVKIYNLETKKHLESKIELPSHDNRVNFTIANFANRGTYIVSCRKMNQPNIVIGSPFIEPKLITVHRFHTNGGVTISHDADSLRHQIFPSGRKVEVWGASDTAGFGTDLYGSPASNKEACDREAAEITNMYQNSDLAYSALLARHFGAELHLQAVAGIGAERNAKWTAWWFKTFIEWLSKTGLVSYVQPMPHYFGNTLGTVAADANDWDFHRWKPDVVLLMLGGNDKDCDAQGEHFHLPSDFFTFYGNVLDKVFHNFAQVHHFPVVVSVCGFSSKSEIGTCNRNAVCDAISIAAAAFNESFSRPELNHYVEIPIGVVPDNATHGCVGHRTADGQRAVAEYLIPRVGNIMKWHPARDDEKKRTSEIELTV